MIAFNNPNADVLDAFNESLNEGKERDGEQEKNINSRDNTYLT